MNFKFKNITAFLLTMSLFSGQVNVFAMHGLQSNEEERIESIIRTPEDSVTISKSLNYCLYHSDSGIIGGARRFFEPYNFHKDEPRKICAYTIPYVLDDSCPLLEDLVDMLWNTNQVWKDIQKGVDQNFVDRTQCMLNRFRKITNINATYVDLFNGIGEYLKDKSKTAEKVSDPPTVQNRIQNSVNSIVDQFRRFGKPAVSSNQTAAELMMKLYFAIDKGSYRSSVGDGYHNVFLMAYDTGADNSSFVARLFKGARPQKHTCVAFTTVQGLDKSTKYRGDIEKGYKFLHDKLAVEVNKFIDYISGQSESNVTSEVVLKELKEIKAQLGDHERRLLVLESQRLSGFSSLLEKLSAVLVEFSQANIHDNNFSVDKFTGICADIDSEIRNYKSGLYEDLKQKKESDELQELSKTVADIRGHVIKHANDIIEIKKTLSKSKDIAEKLAAERERFAEDAKLIQAFADNISCQNEQLRILARETTKNYIVENYSKAGYWGKKILKAIFPELKQMK